MHKLLIVEDDLLLDEAYRAKFEEKYDLRVATDGEKGIEMAKNWIPEAIVLDIFLVGKLNGIDVLNELKRDQRTKDIPVMVITNLPDIMDKVLLLGAAKCFMKTDVDLNLVDESLRDLLK